MPAVSPRIAVYLPKHVASTVRRVAALRGVSMSAVIRDFLEETQPVMERIANLLDLAARTDRSALKEWARTLEETQTEMEAHALGAVQQLDDMEAVMKQHPLPLQKPGRPVVGERRRKRGAAALRRPHRTPGQ